MKFYQTTWFIILMLFAFAPVGIFLMWKFKPNWGKTAKYVLSVAFGFCFLMCCIVAFIPTEETQPTSALPSVSVTNSQTTEPTTEATTKPTTETTTQPETTTRPTTETTKKSSQNSSNNKKAPVTTKKQSVTRDPEEKITVYITKTGDKYHYENPCGNGTYYPIPLAEAKDRGYEPCEKCVLH